MDDYLSKPFKREDIQRVIREFVHKGEVQAEIPKERRILVVEDEPGLRDLFRDILIIEGYDVRVAEDGARGYVLYREFRPHLIFADVVIPKMSGLELVKKIREITPQVKVIFVSGFFGIEPLKQELDAVVLKYGYGVLSKPFKISRMLGLVENYLRGYGYGQSGVNVFA